MSANGGGGRSLGTWALGFIAGAVLIAGAAWLEPVLGEFSAKAAIMAYTVAYIVGYAVVTLRQPTRR